MTPRFRYALGLLLPPSQQAALHCALSARSHNLRTNPALQQPQDPDNAAPIFLDLVTLAQTDIPHPFLRQRVTAALAQKTTENPEDMPETLPASFEITLARLAAYHKKAALFPSPASNFKNFTANLLPRLAAQSVDAAPTQRPHIILPTIPAPRAALHHPFAFTPETLSLIEIDQLYAAHRIVQTFPLPAPAQPTLPFTAPLAA